MMRPITTAPNPTLQRGAALLLALLVVVTVVSFSTYIYWQQWKNLQIETAERQSQQANWLLVAGVDLGRLYLRMDKHSSNVDHLNEPWNIPLEESRLSSFINQTEDAVEIDDEMANDAFISGSIVDYNARLNVLNIIYAGKKNPVYLSFFEELFSQLNLPSSELTSLADNLELAFKPLLSSSKQQQTTEQTLILPERINDLRQYGVSASSINKLRDFVYIYREKDQTATDKKLDQINLRHKININTASANVLQAVLPKVDLASINEIISWRERQYFRAPGDLLQVIKPYTKVYTASAPYLSVTSDLFQANGQLRIDDLLIRSINVLERNKPLVNVLSREYLAVERPNKKF